MCQLIFFKGFFSKQRQWKCSIHKKFIIFLCALIIPYQVLAIDDKPNFVVNAIARAPSSFQQLTNIGDYKASVDQLPYYIEKDTNCENPSRGKIVYHNALTPDNRAYTTSSILGSFFDKLSKESFAQSDDASRNISPAQLRVAVLLNRMRSVDEPTNQEFYNVVDDLPETIEHKIKFCLWEPQWIKRETTETGQTKYIPVALNEVANYYNNLKQLNPTLAHAFLQVNEHQSLNSIVPYRELREVLLKNEATKSLVRSSRTHSPRSPVYIAFMDSDVISLRTGTKGVFSIYEDAINKSPQLLHGLTTGYSVSINQNPIASLAVSLDLTQRRALSTVFPLAPYYPEPNALIRVLDNFETLEVSFPGISWNKHAHYTSPQELPLLIQELVNYRFQGSKARASSHFRFIQEGAIETEVPIRFLQNRKKKDGTKNVKMFSGRFSQETNQFASITLQDLTQVRNTSQSHLKTRDWSGYVYKYLEEQMRPGSIKVIDVDQPGSIVKSRKDQFLISMFSSIHSAYSPIAITLREVKEHGYNPLEYLFSLIHNYEVMVPTTLNITYGGSEGTKLTGNLLRAHVSTYDGLHSVIDKFYWQPVAGLVMQAGRACGNSEIPVIIRYIQYTYKLAIPMTPVNIKVKEDPQEAPRPIVNIRNDALQEAPSTYPIAELTLPNVKMLLRSLYTRVPYTAVDKFAGINRGNAGRIVNNGKRMSTNIREVWSKFNTQNWGEVLNGLDLSLQDLVIIMNTSLDDLQCAKDSNSNFLDAFFCLKNNRGRDA